MKLQFYTMSLQIKIERITGKTEKGYLYVQGSSGGMYTIHSSVGFTDAKRHIMCSKNDKLNFKLCPSQDKISPIHILAQNTQYCTYIVEAIQKSNPNLTSADKTQYSFPLYDKKDQFYGQVTLSIKYDRGLLFMGHSSGTATKHKKRFYPMYLGTCPSKNLFNFLDDGMKEFSMNPIENIYQDE